METRHLKGKLYLSVLIFLVLLNFAVAESQRHVPARILAKQTGATQFEEEQYEIHADCNEHKHHLKKRASDEDVDYEVYQGVVGRPGIDFPIYPRIPKTTFSCRSYGNGYFADMETDCQVFHICEEGRKISFLCPNGTIFQQSELTCDWWFKVNCLGSSGFYADSTELLNKQRVQRLKPSIPVQGFNIVGGGLNIKPRVPAKATTSRSRGGNGNDKGSDIGKVIGSDNESGSGSGNHGNGKGNDHAGNGSGKGNVGGNGSKGSGNNYGNGSGKGNGANYGNGSGKGNGANYGNGSNNGNGSGKGNGANYGNGANNGNGSGKGNGANNGNGSGKGNSANNGSGDNVNIYGNGPSGSSIFGQGVGNGKVGSAGPGDSNTNYKDGNEGPGASNTHYKDGNEGPGASNTHYKVGNDGPGGSNAHYKVGNDGPGGSNTQYKVGKNGPGGSNTHYKVGNDGPGGSNTHYKDGNEGPGGSNTHYKDGNEGPGGSNKQYKVGRDGPSNSNVRVGTDGPSGGNNHYKVGRNGPSGSKSRVGNDGPSGGNSHYKVGRDGPSGTNSRVGGNAGSSGSNVYGSTESSGSGASSASVNSGLVDNNDSAFGGDNSKSERRMDSAEAPSVESVDFDDLSGEKLIKGSTKPDIATIDSNDNDESQITAESASFVSHRNRNTYNQEKTKLDNKSQDQGPKTGSSKAEEGSRRGTGDRGSQRHGYAGLNNDSIEKPRGGSQRGNQRYREDKSPTDDKSSKKDKFTESYDKTNQATSSYGSGTEKPFKTDKSSESSEKVSGQSSYVSGAEKSFKKEKFVENDDKLNHPTPSYVSGTYTTARRLDSTRTTPFYTPTVPSIVKGKHTEGKTYYAKEGTATTPTPNRFSINNNGPGIFLNGAGDFKPTPSPQDFEITGPTTIRSIIIGMRHNYDDSRDRTPDTLNGRKNSKLDFSLPSNHKNFEDDDSSYSTTPAPSGPTYLPKTGVASKTVHESSGDSFLFAPITVAQDQVSRNVNDMLKTIDVLKHNFDEVELVKINGNGNGNGNNRLGLEIPPSSGPDALISLAKYFATTEDGNSANRNVNALGNGNGKKSETKGSSGSSSSHFSASGATSSPSSSSSHTNNPTASDSTLSYSSTNLGTKDSTGPQSRNSVAPKEKPSDTTATLTTESPASVAHNADQISSSLLSNSTVEKYNSLFGLDNSSTSNTEANLSKGLADPNAPKTQDIVTSFPQIGPTDATIRVLATKPESRKIAKVFSNALNDYLNDPVKFRDDLRSARPTEPPADKSFNFVSVTDPTLFNHGTAATYLPTVAPSTHRPYSTTESSLASVINSNLITSTGYPDSGSTTEVFDATTFKTSSEQRHNLEFSAELEPPSSDSGEGEELLQREPTQSFVKNRNDLLRNSDKSGKLTTGKPAEKPWSFIDDEDVLDPLKINDGLMKKHQRPKITTASPATFLTGELGGSSHKSHARDDLYTLVGYSARSNSHEVAGSKHSDKYRTESGDPWADIFDSYNLPKESLPTTTGLQRIANKLFGGLDENEALHLKNVMAEAEHNRQILRLLLLLIQTCDDNNGKALERSRKSLLNALISMDGKLTSGNAGKSSHEKEKTLTTTEKLPVTTYRRTGSGEEITTSTLSYPSTTTDLPTTTLYGSTTDAANSAEAITTTTKFAIIVDDIENDASTTEAGAAAGSSGSLEGNSDKRALELLKSLYSLASKFTSRR